VVAATVVTSVGGGLVVAGVVLLFGVGVALLVAGVMVAAAGLLAVPT